MPLSKREEREALNVAVMELIQALNHNGALWVEVIQGDDFQTDRELPIAVADELFRVYKGGKSISEQSRDCGVRGRLTRVLERDIRDPLTTLKQILRSDRQARHRIHAVVRDKWPLILAGDEYRCGSSHTHFRITSKV